MSLPVRRHRSSTAASRQYTPISSPTATELRALIEVLQNAASARSGLPSVDFLQNQSNTLRRIRQLLIDTPDGGQAKDLFRHTHGFSALLDTIRSVSGFYKPSTLTKEETAGFFELLRATLSVLSDALDEHSGNKRYFAKRVDGNGWRSLEQCLVSTGVAGQRAENLADNSGNEQLFGSLFAFALGEETMSSLFRDISQPRTAQETKPDAQGNSEALEADPAIEQQDVLKLSRERLETRFGGREMLQNADIIPTIFNFWQSLSADASPRNQSAQLRLSVLLALRYIIDLSTFNKAAAHLTGVLSCILPLCFEKLREPVESSVLKSISRSLIAFGVPRLEDAYSLYREAGASEEVAQFLLQALESSQQPPFIQFDLSLNGFSSIELGELGSQFPPPASAGYTFATWIRIDQYDPQSHTNIFGAHDSSQTCFVLAYIEKGSGHLILQTSVSSNKPSVRFREAKFTEGQWYHVTVVHRRARGFTSSLAALFVNGEFVQEVRCPYPAMPPSAMSGSTESFASLSSSIHKHAPIQAYLGTPQGLATRLGRNMVSTKLSLASFHLFQDALSDDLIAVYHKTGPRYSGNYQDSLGSFLTYRASAELNMYNEMLHPGKEESSAITSAMRRKAGNVLPESHIIFSISPSSVMDDDDRNNIDESQLIKSLSKEAARNLHYFTRGGGNPIVINGAVPSINDALTQQRGVGVLHGNPVVVVPQALDDASWRVAGCAAVGLKLIERAQTKDALLRAVEVLFKSIQSNWRNSETMEKESGYPILAALLREKCGIGSSSQGQAFKRLATLEGSDGSALGLELLRIVLRFIGYDEDHPAESIIINPLAYKILLVDTDMWRKSSLETQNLYYDQFVNFAQESKHHHFMQKRLLKTRTVRRLLDALKGESVSTAAFPKFRGAFKALLGCGMKEDYHRCIALFIAYALYDSRAQSKRPTISKQGSLRVSSNRATPSPGRLSAASTRSVSPQQGVAPSTLLSQGELGVRILEVYTEVLCESGLNELKRFARTVNNQVSLAGKTIL